MKEASGVQSGPAQLEGDLHRINRELRREIQERQQAELALRQSEEALRSLVETAMDVIYTIAPDGTITSVNTAFERVAGWERRQWLGRSFRELVHPEDLERAWQMLSAVLAGGRGDGFEARVLHRDGHYMDVELTTAPQMREGNIVGAFGIARDITQRKRTEQALRDQGRILHSILDSMGDGVMVVDKQGKTILMNPAALSIARGVGGDMAVHWRERVPFYQADGQQRLPVERLPIMRALRGEMVVGAELVIRRDAVAEGVWISATATPLRDEQGELGGAVAVFRDVTRGKQSQRQLEESERHFREAADSNRRLLQEIEHRVRNNLAGLLGLVTMMRDRKSSVEEFADAIEHRLLALGHVHQLLFHAKWGPMDLRELVRSLLGAMHTICRHQTEVRISGPPLRILPRQALPLAMTLLEWFSNSCKYGVHSRPGGSALIEWEVGESAAGARAGSDERAATPVQLSWREEGGPTIQGPVTPSLGTQLVHSFVERELRGRCVLSFPPEGAWHRIEFAVPCEPAVPSEPAGAGLRLTPTSSEPAESPPPIHP